MVLAHNVTLANNTIVMYVPVINQFLTLYTNPKKKGSGFPPPTLHPSCRKDSRSSMPHQITSTSTAAPAGGSGTIQTPQVGAIPSRPGKRPDSSLSSAVVITLICLQAYSFNPTANLTGNQASLVLGGTFSLHLINPGNAETESSLYRPASLVVRTIRPVQPRPYRLAPRSIVRRGPLSLPPSCSFSKALLIPFFRYSGRGLGVMVIRRCHGCTISLLDSCSAVSRRFRSSRCGVLYARVLVI